MTLKYIRETYGVPAKRGMRVRFRAWDDWEEGRITSGSHYVIVSPDRWPNARLSFHPTDSENLIYLTSTTAGDRRK